MPPYLLRTDPMALDDQPLQVALLTMEIAALRVTLEAILERHEKIDAG